MSTRQSNGLVDDPSVPVPLQRHEADARESQAGPSRARDHTNASTKDKASTDKRLPACDNCKKRRLKCFPVPRPGSCPRCAEEQVP